VVPNIATIRVTVSAERSKRGSKAPAATAGQSIFTLNTTPT
jgi:hypothetical protein